MQVGCGPQGEAAHPSEVLAEVTITGATLVFVERHIEGPMASVLDPPMTASGFRRQLYVPFQIADRALDFIDPSPHVEILKYVASINGNRGHLRKNPTPNPIIPHPTAPTAPPPPTPA